MSPENMNYDGMGSPAKAEFILKTTTGSITWAAFAGFGFVISAFYLLIDITTFIKNSVDGK